MVGRPLDETSIDETLLYLNITKVEPLESIFRLLWKAFKLILLLNCSTIFCQDFAKFNGQWFGQILNNFQMSKQFAWNVTFKLKYFIILMEFADGVRSS